MSWINTESPIRASILLAAMAALVAAGCLGTSTSITKASEPVDEQDSSLEEVVEEDDSDNAEDQSLVPDDDPLLLRMRAAGEVWMIEFERCVLWTLEPFDAAANTGSVQRTWTSREGVVETCGYNYRYSPGELVLLGPGGSRVHPDGEVEEWGMGSMDVVSVDHLPEGTEVGGDLWYETKEHCEAGLAQLLEDLEADEEPGFPSSLGCNEPEEHP